MTTGQAVLTSLFSFGLLCGWPPVWHNYYLGMGVWELKSLRIAITFPRCKLIRFGRCFWNKFALRNYIYFLGFYSTFLLHIMKWLLCLFYLHYICVILYANKLLTIWNFFTYKVEWLRWGRNLWEPVTIMSQGWSIQRLHTTTRWRLSHNNCIM